MFVVVNLFMFTKFYMFISGTEMCRYTLKFDIRFFLFRHSIVGFSRFKFDFLSKLNLLNQKKNSNGNGNGEDNDSDKGKRKSLKNGKERYIRFF